MKNIFDYIKLNFINLFENFTFHLFYFLLMTRICPWLHLKNPHLYYFHFLHCLKQIICVLQLMTLLGFNFFFHRFFKVFKCFNSLSFSLSYFQNAHVNFFRHQLCQKNSFFFLRFELIRLYKNFIFHCSLLVNLQELVQLNSSCC